MWKPSTENTIKRLPFLATVLESNICFTLFKLSAQIDTEDSLNENLAPKMSTQSTHLTEQNIQDRKKSLTYGRTET